MKDTSLRTQILLPKKLREQIDRARFKTGESLGEYLRLAAQERIKKENMNIFDLKALANRVIGSAQGTRSEREINQWLTQIREDRKADDIHRNKRMKQARKFSKQQISGKLKQTNLNPIALADKERK